MLMGCLQILKKFCARETLKPETSTDTGNTNNSHKRNSRTQRQGTGNLNLPSNQELKKECDKKKASTTQQTSQLQWDGQRTTLRLYLPKWHDLLKGSKSKKALKVLQRLVPPNYRNRI